MPPANDSIPHGRCHCGCGERTNIAPRTHASDGWIKGKPIRFIAGHQRRSSPVEYIEEDRGFTTPCWIWQRSKTKGGYGTTDQDGKTVCAHRAVYERMIGPIPPGKHLDHLCEVRSCVRPSHMAVVTPKQNVRRALRHETCKQGHDMTPANTVHKANGTRTCRACRNDYQRARYQRHT